MKRLSNRITLLVAAVAAALTLLSASTASATIWTLSGVIDGLQETPPNTSPATGFGSLTLNDVTGLVTMTFGAYSNLTAIANNAHIHGLAPPGTPAGVLIPLTFTAATSGTLSGSGTLTAPQVAGMLAGQTYFNVHTVGQYSGGEIRGQITVVPEPATLTLVGLSLASFAARAWRKRANRS